MMAMVEKERIVRNILGPDELITQNRIHYYVLNAKKE